MENPTTKSHIDDDVVVDVIGSRADIIGEELQMQNPHDHQAASSSSAASATARIAAVRERASSHDEPSDDIYCSSAKKMLLHAECSSAQDSEFQEMNEEEESTVEWVSASSGSSSADSSKTQESSGGSRLYLDQNDAYLDNLCCAGRNNLQNFFPLESYTSSLSEEQERSVKEVCGNFSDIDFLSVVEDIVEKEKTAEELIDRYKQYGYPRWQARAKRIYQEQRWKQLTSEENFSPDAFLKVIPDPSAFLERPLPTQAYKTLCRTVLMNEFPAVEEKTILEVMDVNNGFFFPSFLELESFDRNKSSLSSPHYRKVEALPEFDTVFAYEFLYAKHHSEIHKFVEMKTLERQMLVDKARANGRTRQCTICLDEDLLDSDMANCSDNSDSHSFCVSCVRSHADYSIGQGRTVVKCLEVDCGNEFSVGILKQVLFPQQLDRLFRLIRRDELLSADIKDLVHCPFCDFAASLPDSVDVLQCLNPRCLEESCRKCEREAHGSLSCEEAFKSRDVDAIKRQIQEKMSEALIRKCPQCLTAGVKEYGCNKMFCGKCNARFCYVCRKLLDTRNPYIHYEKPGGCKMNSSDHEVHNVPVKAAAAETKKALLKKNPHVTDSDIGELAAFSEEDFGVRRFQGRRPRQGDVDVERGFRHWFGNGIGGWGRGFVARRRREVERDEIFAGLFPRDYVAALEHEEIAMVERLRENEGPDEKELTLRRMVQLNEDWHRYYRNQTGWTENYRFDGNYGHPEVAAARIDPTQLDWVILEGGNRRTRLSALALEELTKQGINDEALTSRLSMGLKGLRRDCLNFLSSPEFFLNDHRVKSQALGWVLKYLRAALVLLVVPLTSKETHSESRAEIARLDREMEEVMKAGSCHVHTDRLIAGWQQMFRRIINGLLFRELKVPQFCLRCEQKVEKLLFRQFPDLQLDSPPRKQCQLPDCWWMFDLLEAAFSAVRLPPMQEEQEPVGSRTSIVGSADSSKEMTSKVPDFSSVHEPIAIGKTFVASIWNYLFPKGKSPSPPDNKTDEMKEGALWFRNENRQVLAVRKSIDYGGDRIIEQLLNFLKGVVALSEFVTNFNEVVSISNSSIENALALEEMAGHVALVKSSETAPEATAAAEKLSNSAEEEISSVEAVLTVQGLMDLEKSIAHDIPELAAEVEKNNNEIANFAWGIRILRGHIMDLHHYISTQGSEPTGVCSRERLVEYETELENQNAQLETLVGTGKMLERRVAALNQRMEEFFSESRRLREEFLQEVERQNYDFDGFLSMLRLLMSEYQMKPRRQQLRDIDPNVGKDLAVEPEAPTPRSPAVARKEDGDDDLIDFLLADDDWWEDVSEEEDEEDQG